MRSLTVSTVSLIAFMRSFSEAPRWAEKLSASSRMPLSCFSTRREASRAYWFFKLLSVGERFFSME